MEVEAVAKQDFVQINMKAIIVESVLDKFKQRSEEAIKKCFSKFKSFKLLASSFFIKQQPHLVF